MDFGFPSTGPLTGLREGVEAALIMSIILAYLAKTGNRRHFGKIWLGAGAAVALSIAIGAALFATIGGFEEPAEQISRVSPWWPRPPWRHGCCSG